MRPFVFLYFSTTNKTCVDLEYLHDAKYWTKGNLLGKGRFDVRLYSHIKEDLQVAVKQVKFDPNDIANVKEIVNEIKILVNLSHDRIVKYLGCHKDEENFVLSVCLEYMPGGSLYELLQSKGPLDFRTTMTFTRQILEGVEYLHGQNIIHQEIKGKNILIDQVNSALKLADFGLSIKLGTLSSTYPTTANLGKIHWTAPEIVKGINCGNEADIWSVGCTVVEMLTQYPPWKELDEIEVAVELVKENIRPSYPEQSDTVNGFLNHCFQVNPKNRPSAKDLLLLCKQSLAAATDSNKWAEEYNRYSKLNEAMTNY